MKDNNSPKPAAPTRKLKVSKVSNAHKESWNSSLRVANRIPAEVVRALGAIK